MMPPNFSTHVPFFVVHTEWGKVLKISYHLKCIEKIVPDLYHYVMLQIKISS